MHSKEGFVAPENQETQQPTPEEPSKIGGKVTSLNERINKGPFSPLSDKTIQSILEAPSADERDVEAAKKEAEARKNSGHYDPESNNVSVKQDLEDNYFTINEGRLLTPTDEYVKYRDALKNGEERDYMRGQVRETVEEREARLSEEALGESKEIKREPKSFSEEIEEYFKDAKHREEALETEPIKAYPKEQTMQRIKGHIARIDNFVKQERKNSKKVALESYATYLENELAADRIPDESVDHEQLKYDFLQESAKEAIWKHTSGTFRRNDFLRVAHLFADVAKQSQNAETYYAPLDELAEGKKKDALRRAISRGVFEGTFLPNTSKVNPESVKQFLAEKRIEPKEYTEDAVAYICSDRSNKNEQLAYAYSRIFDTKNALVDDFRLRDADKYGMVRLEKSEDGKCELRSNYPESIAAPVIEAIQQSADKKVEKILRSESYKQRVENAKQLAVGRVNAYIKREVIKRRDRGVEELDIDALTAIKKVDASGYFGLENYISKQYYTKDYRDLIRSKLPPIEANVDTKPFIRNALMNEYKTGGVGADGEPAFDLPYLGREKFKDIAEQLDMTFEDDESYDAVFGGFIESLRATNGENTRTPYDFYRSIFSDDPERFISKLNAFRENDCPNGLKAKITRFLNKNEDYQAYVQQKKALEELGLEKSVMDKRAILEATSYEDVRKLIEERKNELLAELEAKSEDANTVFGREERGPQEHNFGGADIGTKEAVLDFGIEKLSELNRWSLYLENNVDPDTRHFMRRFYENRDKLSAYNDPNTYHAITFEYSGQLCAIAESFSNDSSAMFVARADRDMAPEDLVEKMFESTKTEARGRKDIGVERFYHYEDGLDSLYQKAFAYLKTGQRASNAQEAQKIGNKLLGDESEMGKIVKDELPPQYPFI